MQKEREMSLSWSMDLMSDSIIACRKFRIFIVIDDCSKEILSIEIGTTLNSKREFSSLNRINQKRGLLKPNRTDMGREFTTNDFEI